MNTPTRSLMAALMMTTLAVAPLAEAKRMGGGKSSGMSRSTAPNTSSSTNNSAVQSAQPVRPVAPVASAPMQAAPVLIRTTHDGRRIEVIGARICLDGQPEADELVVIDTMRQIEAQLVMRNYEGFLK